MNPHNVEIVTMTNWLPDVSAGTGPIYVRLADQIETAITDGTLPSGAKLPPQRNLAFDIGVTIGTVGRAYALVHERGLVSGEVGRGTYVLPPAEANSTTPADPIRTSWSRSKLPDADPAILRFDTTAAPDVGQADNVSEAMAAIMREHPLDMTSYTRIFPQHWFEAGARWLARGNWRPSPDSIVPALGAHAAIMAVISAVTAPGDKVLFEHLTYSRISRSASLIGRRTVLAEADGDGLRPDEFERLCAQQHPKLAFLMPTGHNPTAISLPEERRRAIAEVARKYNVMLIEDDLYGAMIDDTRPLLAEFAPERTFVVGGFSKSVAAGIRGGWVSCPAHFSQRVSNAHKMVTGGMPFMLGELCARLVMTGEADAIRRDCITEVSLRESSARRIFEGHDLASRPGIPFLWLKLPDPWLSGVFKNAAFREGVLIDDEDEFKAGRSDRSYHRVRIGFSTQASIAQAERGFHILRRLLETGDAGYDSYA